MGNSVDFLLDDVANGENDFAPLPKADMPQIVNDLTRGLKAAKRQVEDGGKIFEESDWAEMGSILDQRMEELLKDEPTFRAIAAGLGYGYEEFQEADLDQLRADVKDELFKQIESVTPHERTLLFDPEAGPTLLDQAKQKAALESQRNINQSVLTAAGKKDAEFFKNSLVGRVKGIDNVKIKDGKLYMIKGFGKKASVIHAYDLNNQGDLFRLTELFGGNRDLAQIESSIINF